MSTSEGNEEGASYKEQLLDACRRGNDSLVKEVLEEINDPDKIAELINTSKDPLGNSALHLATQYGHYNALDLVLADGVDVDIKNRIDQETPLHLAVKYTHQDFDYGKFLVEEFIICGADPSIKNKYGEKPADLIRGEGEEQESLRDQLEEAEYAIRLSKTTPSDNVAEEVTESMAKLEVDDGEESGSESPSDDDEEKPAPSSLPPPPPPK